MRLRTVMRTASLARRSLHAITHGSEDERWYASELPRGTVSPQAYTTARTIRDRNAPPALMIYGVTPRSGTVYLTELLYVHPDLASFPNRLWEIPFLRCAGDLLDFQDHFLADYKPNQGKLREHDFVALFGAAFLRYLQGFAPPGKTLLLKEPDMRFLHLFPVAFPGENLLLLMRDGRDVVHSSMRTWPTSDFANLCQRWADGARTMRMFMEHHDRLRQGPNYWYVKYEDVLENPAAFVRRACERFGLDPDRYPYEALTKVKAIGSSSLNKPGQVGWAKSAVAPKGFKPVGHWHDWKPKERTIFKRIAGDELIKAGYCTDLDW